MTGGNTPAFEGRRGKRREMPSRMLQYSVAVLSVFLALGITFLLSSYLEPIPTSLFFAAVMVSAWYGGLGPGIFATILSLLAINYFLIEPIYALKIPTIGTFMRLSVFGMAAVLINSLNESQRSARRRAETSLKFLRESEARFGCLAQSNIIGMLVAKLNGPILEANDIFLQMIGYTQEELRSGRLSWREITPPKYLEVSERAVQELLTTGACVPFEKEYIRKDGSCIPVLHGAIMTGDGTVTGFVLDLSERKRAEALEQESIRRERELHAQVQAANIQLETVLASINDQFLVFDREWRYTYVSDRVVEVVNKPREELLGQCIWELFPDTVGTQFYLELHRAVAEQSVVQFEYFYPSWQRWFENRVYPSAAGVSVLVTDITDRKVAEEALQRTNQTLQTLLDACPVAIAFFDPKGIVKLWNRAAEQIFGWSAEEAIGQFMPTVPHRQQEFLTSIQTVLSGCSLDGFEAQHQRKDGQWVDLEIWATLADDAEGNPGCLGIAVNITERKRAEAALRESEARFQVLVSNMPGMIYRYVPSADGTAVFTYVSSGSRELVELEPETLLRDANSFLSLIHPDDFPSFQASVAIAVENCSLWQWEGRLITPSGQLKWIQGRSCPESTEYGVVWDGLFFDITDRKQAEAALRQSETTLSALIASAPIGIALCDQNLRYVHINESLAATNGVPLEDHIGQTFWDILPEWAPILAPILQHVMKTKEPLLNQEITGATHPSDIVRYGLVNYFPVCLPDGEVIGLGVTSMDITDRRRVEESLRQSEERFRQMAETISDIFWMMDVEQEKVLYISPAFEKIWGRSRELLYQEWGAGFAYIHPEDQERTASISAQALQTNGFEIEYRIVRPDGTIRWLRDRSFVVPNEQGQPTRLVGVAQDITDRKQAETEREQLLIREKRAREQAETANRIKDEFLAVLSHELRSPLNPILGWSKLLQEGKLNEQMEHRALETIERNAKLQTQLIDDLLDVSRILRGKISLKTNPTNLITVIESALETVRLAAEAKQIEIKTSMVLDNGQVLGDATRLQQIVWNLLSNAVKFTPSGGQIDVYLDQIGVDARIQVKDTGKGISPDFLPYVFDYFRQEDGKTTRKFGGLGLGLAIVRYLVELHGGTVQAESFGEGQGATFTVQLPLMTAPRELATVPVMRQAANFSQLRILIVDDNEDMGVLAQAILEKQGAHVVVVTSASEVLTLLEHQSFDVLISDIGMPDIDGYMLMQQVRALPPERGGQILAIALTAYAGESDQQQALTAGFQEHLPKPIEPATLVRAISELIDLTK